MTTESQELELSIRAVWLPKLLKFPLLRMIPEAALPECEGLFRFRHFPDKSVIVREGDMTRSMFLVLQGEARVWRSNVQISVLQEGQHFGELSLFSLQPRAATVVADSDMILAELSEDSFEQMATVHPDWALAMVRQVVNSLRDVITNISDNLEVLLRERYLPKKSDIVVKINGDTKRVRMGTPVKDVLPELWEGEPVVGALFFYKPQSIDTLITSDTKLTPLTLGHWEGYRLYRRSLGLLLLEAAQRLEPPLACQMGSSMGFAQIVELEEGEERTPEQIVEGLQQVMSQLVEEKRPFITEQWSVEGAITLMQRQGWLEAATLLQHRREGFVPLATCGEVFVPNLTPFVPNTSYLRGFYLAVQNHTLLLYFGHPQLSNQVTPSVSVQEQQPKHDRITIDSVQQAELANQQWLRTLCIRGVGSYNQYCISGHVSDLISVSEGFHEKCISLIADEIAKRRELKIVTIAGPSSSGKTTFIKRLTVQLKINGINPHSISLDDYYVDREKTAKDEHGEYDFEALQAIDLPLLHEHIEHLMLGESVKTARYDFVTGTSSPNGGATLQLAPHHILLLEGLHGLNPGILPSCCSSEQVFRIFVNPMTGIPMDRLNRVHVSDIRLLRRIVRDRYYRNINAAQNIMRWPSVRRGERKHIYPFLEEADAKFNSSLLYEISVLKVFADRYLMEVPREHPAFTTAFRLRLLIEQFVTIYPDHVPPTSLLREFIGGSSFEY